MNKNDKIPWWLRLVALLVSAGIMYCVYLLGNAIKPGVFGF